MIRGSLIALGLVVILTLSVVFWWIGVNNTEVGLRNQFIAQVSANQADFDTMWKTIQQKYQISSEYAQAFKDIVTANVQGRSGGALFKSIQETVPGLDPSIYRDIMATIEGKRNQFEAHQKKMVDIKREHDDIRGKFPSSFVVGGRPALVLQLVTSEKTNEAFTSGQDNDVRLK
jgi:hypothetical protein